MLKLAAWNVRGLNDLVRQVEVRNFVASNKISLMVIIETKVKFSSSSVVMKKIRTDWGWAHNYDRAYNGRLWVCWDRCVLAVQILQVDAQLIHMRVDILCDNISFLYSVVYAYNSAAQRESWWNRLRSFDIQLPWILLGDFNTVLVQEVYLQGGEQVGVDTRELQSLTSDLHIADLHYTGNMMTWCNRREGNARIYCKLDRVLTNESWIQVFPTSHVMFLPNGSSDHVPWLVSIGSDESFIPRPFRFCNMWAKNQQFLADVDEAWRK